MTLYIERVTINRKTGKRTNREILGPAEDIDEKALYAPLVEILYKDYCEKVKTGELKEED